MSLPPPSVLLGVPGFPGWYPAQQDAFRGIMDWYYSPSRFLGLSQPTGGGKSCLAVLLAKMSGVRTCILTATKGLQNQLLQDFGSISVLVKGQNNFRCSLVPTMTAEEGPCHEGLSCSYSRSNGCPYREQLRRALDGQIVITNYAYYLAQTRFSSGIGEFGLLVCDEGHLAFSALENHLTIFLSRMDIEPLGIQFLSLPTSDIYRYTGRRKKSDAEQDTISPPDLWAQWRSWASCSVPIVQGVVDCFGSEVQELHSTNSPVPGALSRAYRTSKSVLAKINSLATASGDWVIQKTHNGYLFTPKWVSEYGDAIFGSVPKVMLMSAILSRKTADSIGVPDGDARAWLDVGSYFPSKNTPIWHVPTTRVSYRTDDYGTTIWQARIDQIIQRRLDRKGIVFTVSYDRARLLLSRSRYKGIMLTHSTGDVALVVNRFKAMKPPVVLVSPTVTTGWDFPGLDYIVVGKIPYPNTKDLVVQARHAEDKDWSSYLAMDTLVQECGRGTRSVDDRCEVLIVDDNAIWFMYEYAKFAPRWFMERWRGSLPSVPDPLV